VTVEPGDRRPVQLDEAPTDPCLPRVTEQMLAVRRRTRDTGVPGGRDAASVDSALSDAALARMLAELDGAGHSPGAGESGAGRSVGLGGSRRGLEGTGTSSSLPRQRSDSDVAATAGEARVAAESNVDPVAVTAGLDSDPEPEEPMTFGPPDDPSVLRQAADGPVLRSRYGDFRPPVPVGRRSRDPERDWYLPDAPSLTGLGLTRRSWSRRGSRLFHWAFLAIFVLIALQIAVGLISAAASP